MLYRLPPPSQRPPARPQPRPAAGTPARVAAPASVARLPTPRPAPVRLPPSSPPPRRTHEDEVLWDIADIEGRVLATRVNRVQVRARIEAGILGEAALAQKSGESDWRPISDALGGSGARRIARYWYVTRKGGEIVGPVETTLVERGIIAGRVPLDSQVCEVGDDYWSPLEAVEQFRDAIEEAKFDEEVTSSIDIETGGSWSITG